MKVLFYEHIAAETYQEYEVNSKTYREIIEEIGVTGCFSIVCADEVFYYPDCADQKPTADIIHVKRVPKGGKVGSIITNTLMVVGGVFAILSGGAWIALGVGMLASGLAGIASSVMTPNMPQLKEQEAIKEAYGLSGSKNKESLGSTYPVVFGRHRITPPLIGRYYTSLSNNSGSGDQYLTFLLCAGYKDLKLTDFKIGMNELHKNSEGILNGLITKVSGTYNAKIEIRQDGTYPSLYPHKVYEEQLNAELKYFDSDAAIKEVRTTIKNTTAIAVMVMFQGLFSVNKKGQNDWASAAVALKWRKKGTLNWSGSLYQTYSSNKNEMLRFMLEHTFTPQEIASNPGGEWEVILYRTSPASTSSSVVNKGYWGNFQCKTNVPPVLKKELDKMCVVAIQVVANQQTNGVLDQINCLAESVLPVWNGRNWSTKQVTSNPAAHYLSVLKGNYLTRQVKDSRIDYPAFQDLYEWCDKNDYQCNGVISNPETVFNVLNKILSTCRAKFYLKNGLYSLVHDVEKPYPMALLSPKNSSGFQSSKTFPDVIDAIDARFNDEISDFKATNEVIRPYGVSEKATETKQSLSLWGVTQYKQVVQLARYMLACNELRPESCSLTVSLEHFSIPVGSRVLLQHDVLLVGQLSGSIVGVEGRQITLDEVVQVQPSGNYCLRVFKKNGDIILIPVESPINPSNTLKALVDVDISESDIYAFGLMGKETQDCLVSGKEVNENFSAKLTLIPYAPDVFFAAEKEIPPYDPKVTIPRPYDLSFIGEQIEESEGIKMQDDGSIYLDLAAYACKSDDRGSYVYNQGALASLGNAYYTDIEFSEDFVHEEKVYWAHLKNGNMSFQVDNLLWTDTSISFWIKDMIASENRQMIFDYHDDVNNNVLQMYVQNNCVFVVTQNCVESIELDLIHATHVCLVRSFKTMQTHLYINGKQQLSFDFDTLIYNLIGEVDFNLISEQGENLTSEECILKKSALNRNEKVYFFSDKKGENAASFSLREVHLYGRSLNQKDIESLFESGILIEKMDTLNRFLGRFSEIPTNAKNGDSFYYEGLTNEYFMNGSVYLFTIGGWILMEDK